MASVFSRRNPPNRSSACSSSAPGPMAGSSRQRARCQASSSAWQAPCPDVGACAASPTSSTLPRCQRASGSRSCTAIRRRARGGVASMTAPMGSGQFRTGGAPCATRRPARRPPTRAPAPASAPARPPNRPCAAPAPRCRRARHAPIVVDGSAVHQVARAFGHADPVDEALIDRRVAAGHMGPRHRGHASVRADDQVRAQAPAVREVHDGPAIRIVGDGRGLAAERHRHARLARPPEQHRLQVRAQDGASGISHQAIQRLDIKAAQRPALGVVAMHGGGRAAQRQHLVQQFQIRQHEAGIRPQRHARPHRGRRRAALVDPGSCPRRASARAVANPATSAQNRDIHACHLPYRRALAQEPSC